MDETTPEGLRIRRVPARHNQMIVKELRSKIRRHLEDLPYRPAPERIVVLSDPADDTPRPMFITPHYTKWQDRVRGKHRYEMYVVYPGPEDSPARIIYLALVRGYDIQEQLVKVFSGHYDRLLLTARRETYLSDSEWETIPS